MIRLGKWPGHSRALLSRSGTRQRHLAGNDETTDNLQPAPSSRLRDIDLAKGFAIALVVWGHTAGAPLTPRWYNISINVLYSFHMPFFMYLSGYVFFAVNAQERFLRQPIKYTTQRFDRLMIPFFAFAIVVVFGKYVASSLGPVDDNVKGVASGLYDVLTNSRDNPCLAVWYLISLFVYSICAPMLWRLGNKTMVVILAVGCAGWVVTLPDIFYAKRIGLYFIFFGVGGFVAVHRQAFLPYLKRAFVATLPTFFIICYVMLDNRLAMLVCGLASIPAIHGMFLQNFWGKDRIFVMLGSYSLTIYLFNTIFIGTAKLIYLRLLSHGGNLFYVVLIGTFFAGLLGPVILLRILDWMPRSLPVSRYLR